MRKLILFFCAGFALVSCQSEDKLAPQVLEIYQNQSATISDLIVQSQNFEEKILSLDTIGAKVCLENLQFALDTAVKQVSFDEKPIGYSEQFVVSYYSWLKNYEIILQDYDKALALAKQDSISQTDKAQIHKIFRVAFNQDSLSRRAYLINARNGLGLHNIELKTDELEPMTE